MAAKDILFLGWDTAAVRWEGRGEGTWTSAFESHHTQTDRCSHRQADVPSRVLITHSHRYPRMITNNTATPTRSLGQNNTGKG